MEQKIYDPAEYASYLTDDNVTAHAETVANDVHLREDIGRIAAGELRWHRDATPESKPSTAERKFLYALATSSRSLRALMSDQYGRSEIHISGEICRAVRRVRQVFEHEDDSAYRDFVKVLRPHGENERSWSDKSAARLFPTIDGNPNKLVGPTHPSSHSFHQFWMTYFLSVELPSACSDYLTIIEPPFVLTNGCCGLVVDKEPAFYIQKSETAEEAAPIPRELVSV